MPSSVKGNMKPTRSHPPPTVRSIGRTLDRLYLFGGGVSRRLCLVAIVVLIVMTWGARVFGIKFSAGTEYAGYAMAAASFMAFAYTLNHAAHIRVTLGLTALGRYRRFGEVWCFLLGAIIASWIAWEAVEFTWNNFERGRRSSGADATPLWIPQVPMALGAVLLGDLVLGQPLRLAAPRFLQRGRAGARRFPRAAGRDLMELQRHG